MEKKNTILLTAIAVGTLLVVVVGATYAYFAVSSSDSENTTVDANVEGVGSVALSGGAEITKTISAADMAKSKAPSTYDLGVANIATATLTDTVGTATYYCEFTLTVTNGSNMTTNGSTDGGIDVTVANNVSITTISGSDFTRGANLAPTAINAGTYKVEFQMGVGDTSVPSGTNLIELTGAIKNSETDDTQDERLAGKNINLEYAVAGFSCDTTKHTLSSKVISLVGNGQVFDEGEAGFRYEGAEVDNWVSFNDETWRIIGVQEGSTIGLESGKYYTKIIRDLEKETGLAYDSDGNHGSNWSTTSLYTTLNGDYYNRTGVYANNGLTTTSKGLIVDANWYYTPLSTNGYTSSEFYTNERSDSTKVVKDAVGIMSPSDYGYGALQSECSSTTLVSYNTSCALKDWLFDRVNEALITPCSSNVGYSFYVINYGNVYSTGSVISAGTVRPVLYLDSDVVITNDGDGSIGAMFEVGR